MALTTRGVRDKHAMREVRAPFPRRGVIPLDRTARAFGLCGF